MLSVRPLDPPGGVVGHLDPGLGDQVADLPRRPVAVGLDGKVRRHAEVPFAAGRETDVAAGSRDPKRTDVLAYQVLADDVPGAVVLEKRVWVERSLFLGVSGGRPVIELDRALLRDRALELPESARELGRVLGVEHLHP